MNEQELKELNGKLAEWAGFVKREGVKTFKKEGGTLYTETGDWWKTPSVCGYQGEYEFLPNFTQSLDACFKWLVPKLEEWGIASDYTHPQMLGYIATATLTKPFSHQVAHAETPALAFCLAIEQLIDAGAKAK